MARTEKVATALRASWRRVLVTAARLGRRLADGLEKRVGPTPTR